MATMSDRNDDRAGRWGRNKQSRAERGYSINDRSMQSRDNDRDHSRRDDGYYGRGYEQRPRYADDRGYDEESRYSHGRGGRGYVYGEGYDDRRRSRHREDDERYEKGSRHSQSQEWRCEECGIYNYDVDERCARCSTRPRDTSRYRSMSRDDRPDEERDVEKPEEPKWPPPFESGGAAYDFHPGSGMFFESRANFFYDPKTKLYFGNKQKKYYTYRPGEDPPFCALDTQPTSGEAASVDTAAGPKPEDKKKIAISLKTTTLPGEKAAKKPKAHKAPKKVKAAPPEPKKQDAANIEVWAERGKEIRDETTKNVTMTTTNKPVCLLCRRKFASVEKLKKHEELSALHKENLEKKRKEDEAKARERESSSDYRDRALERRIMHGPEAASLPALPRDLNESSTTVGEADVVRPEDNLGASNVGNQMLQKLGWKTGSSLGRGVDGTQNSAQNTLVKDWEKIETLAASGQQGRMQRDSRECGIGN